MKIIKPKKVLILHGWDATSESCWFAKAKNIFEKKGLEVFVPDLPGAYFPKKEEWLKVISSYKPDEEWVLVGHSLGGVAILRFLEDSPHKINHAVIVASPINEMKFGALENFFTEPFDWKSIKSNAQKIDLIYERDDGVTPLEHGMKIAQKIDAQLYIQEGDLHCYDINVDFLVNLALGRRQTQNDI